MNIRVGIIDDHKLFRKSFSLLVSQLENVEVVLECSNGIELLESLRKTDLDILFLDIQMPIMDGFEVACLLNKKFPKLKILVLSSFNDSHSIERMLKYNVSGYLTKNSTLTELKKAMLCVYEGGVYYDRQIRGIIKELKDPINYKPTILTEKEIEIIRLYARQYNGRQVAEILNLSLRTIEKHKEIIMHKIGVSNFVGVIVFALLRHYINEDDLNI